jgi:hypothetical protein
LLLFFLLLSQHRLNNNPKDEIQNKESKCDWNCSIHGPIKLFISAGRPRIRIALKDTKEIDKINQERFL